MENQLPRLGYRNSLSNMNQQIDARIERVADAIPVIVERLRNFGFSFCHSDCVLAGPESNVVESIARIESEIGVVPYTVACFWQRIGSVDLTGIHAEWSGCDYPDSLVVLPPSDAICELIDFLADREERLASNSPFLIPIAPDSYHKENVSGGMWYNVDCPATADDPILNDERHNIRFLDYLELAINWGGFPGLDVAGQHNWPIDELSAGLRDVA